MIKSFCEFHQMLENHKKKELLEEDFKKTAGALALSAASLLPINHSRAETNKPAITQSAIQARLDAMKRVSQVHKFKKNWSGFEQEKEMAIFDAILKLETEKDHDDLLAKLTKDRDEAFKIQMLGRYHPDKEIEKSEKRMINNSYSFQYQDYLKALVLASKLNL